MIEQSIPAFEAHLVDARNRERFGLAARNEVLAVEVERDRAELERLRAQRDTLVACANLGSLVGLAPTTSIVPLAMSFRSTRRPAFSHSIRAFRRSPTS